MSVYATRWALEFLADGRGDHLTPTARVILLSLAGEANHKTGEATTGWKRMMAITGGVHRYTILRACRELVDVVPATPRPGKSTVWHFPVSAGIRTSSTDATTSAVHTSSADATTELSTPVASESTAVASALLHQSRQRYSKGFGVSTYVETREEGAPDAVAQVDPIDTRPPWIVLGIGYGTWLRRERAAGRGEEARQRREAQ